MYTTEQSQIAFSSDGCRIAVFGEPLVELLGCQSRQREIPNASGSVNSVLAMFRGGENDLAR